MKAPPPVLPLLAQAVRQVLDAATGGPNLPPITQPAAATPSAPAVLARAPALRGGRTAHHDRAGDEQLYTRCLALYRERVQAGAEHDDLGCAAALFVMANLTVLGRDGADLHTIQALTQQMQNALQRLPHWPQVSLTARQQMFEQLALLSVLVTQSWEAAAQQGPPARAHVRAAAHAYLRSGLAVNPDLLGLSPQGLVVVTSALGRQVNRVLAA